jgi:hypothetical protein
MAVTDALGSAMKMVGVAADIYSGTMAETKYQAPYIDYVLQQQCKDIFDKIKDGLNPDQANYIMDLQKKHLYRDAVEYMNGNTK